MEQKTFNELFTEMNAFPYSKECYDLMVESAELSLFAQYLENQYYMANNAEFIKENTSVFGEGYFKESVANEQLELLEKEFTEKAGNFADKIKNGAEKVWNILKDFVARIINTWDEDIKLINDVRKKLASADIETETLNKILETGAAKYKISVAKGQRAAKGIKLKNSSGVKTDLLAVALSTDYVKIYSTSSYQAGSDHRNNSGNAINLEDLKKIKACANPKVGLAMLDEAIERTHDKGVEINVNSAKLKQIQSAFETEGKSIRNDALINADIDASNEDLKAVTDFIKKLNTSVSHSCNLYGNLTNFRHYVAGEITKLVGESTKSSSSASSSDSAAATA